LKVPCCSAILFIPVDKGYRNVERQQKRTNKNQNTKQRKTKQNKKETDKKRSSFSLIGV
jgi:hypothetical protein